MRRETGTEVSGFIRALCVHLLLLCGVAIISIQHTAITASDLLALLLTRHSGPQVMGALYSLLTMLTCLHLLHALVCSLTLPAALQTH
jgi:hypothetical protein